MKFLSLFDGCHMFGHALRNVGAECVGTSEIDKHAAAVTAYHYPETPALGDVQNVKSTNADLIVAGFPCQDLSVAGDRRGLAGERSGLFWEIVRIARDNATPWLLLENVPGLLSSNGGRDMGAVVGALGQLGYGWAYRVLDAQHFGVPQRRRRVFIVGCLGDSRRAAEVLFERESVRGDSAPSRQARAGSAGCLSAGVSVGGLVSHTLTGEGFDASEDGTGRGTPIVARCLTAHSGRLNAATEDFVLTDPSPTLASTGRPAAFNWRGDDYAPGVRRLMPIECERLQGLPDDWTKHGRKSDGTTYEQSDSARYRMIGNGGAVPVVEWIGRRIMMQEARV